VPRQLRAAVQHYMQLQTRLVHCGALTLHSEGNMCTNKSVSTCAGLSVGSGLKESSIGLRAVPAALHMSAALAADAQRSARVARQSVSDACDSGGKAWALATTMT